MNVTLPACRARHTQPHRTPSVAVGAGPLLLAAVIAAGCDNATAPLPPPTLPGSVESTLAAIYDIATTRVAISLGSRVVESFGVWFSAGGRMSASRLQAVALSPARAVFDDSVLGGTFVFVCDSGYRRNPALTGAPADGIRLFLYQENDAGYPECPLVQIALADLRDVGSDAAPALRLTATSPDGAVSYVDFTVHLTTTPAGFTAAATGFLSDGLGRIDIAAQVQREGSTVRDSAVVTRPGSSARLTTWLMVESADTMTERVVLALDADSVRAEGVSSPGSVRSLEIVVNGRSFGSVAYSDGVPSYAGPSGRAVTAAERSAMDWLATMTPSMVTILSYVLNPAGWVMGFDAFPWHAPPPSLAALRRAVAQLPPN